MVSSRCSVAASAGESRDRTSASVASATASSSARRSAPAGVRSTRTTRRSPVSRVRTRRPPASRRSRWWVSVGALRYMPLGQLPVGHLGLLGQDPQDEPLLERSAVDGQALVEALAG